MDIDLVPMYFTRVAWIFWPTVVLCIFNFPNALRFGYRGFLLYSFVGGATELIVYLGLVLCMLNFYEPVRQAIMGEMPLREDI